jgi:type III secretory pathway component EscT
MDCYVTSKDSFDLQPVFLLLPAALLIVLLILLFYCDAIVKQMCVLSEYFIITKSSLWEGKYKEFSNERRYNQKTG